MKALLAVIITALAWSARPAYAAVSVLTCEPEWAALAAEIGGTLVSAESATTPAQDPHYIQARPSLIAKVRKAGTPLRTTLDVSAKGRQDVPTESTVLSARDGSFIADPGPTPDWFVVARRIVGMAPRSTPDETDPRDPATSERAWRRTNLSTYRAVAQVRAEPPLVEAEKAVIVLIAP